MKKIEEIFDSLFDELIAAIEKQRDLHTSAFGKDNAQEMVATAENNRQKLDCWWSLLQDIKSEMMESGLFTDDKRASRLKRSNTPLRINTDTFSRNIKPVSVTVLGQHTPVRYWKDIVLFVCKILYEKQPHRFAEVENEPTLQGRNRPYISIDKSVLRKPEKIEGSPYFVEINLSQLYCKKIAHLLLEFFGYAPSDMVIEETNKGSV